MTECALPKTYSRIFELKREPFLCSPSSLEASKSTSLTFFCTSFTSFAMPRTKSSRHFEIGVSIDAVLNRNINVPKEYYGTASQTTAKEEDSYSTDGDESWQGSYGDSDSDSEYFDSSESGSDIDEGDFYGELQSWMLKLTQSKRVPQRSNSMPLIGAQNLFPKYKDQIHHPIVANRIRKCNAEFMQNPDEVLDARKAKKDPDTEKPDDCVMRILASVGKQDTVGLEPHESSFLEVTEERVAAHCKEMTDAARSVNIKLLKQFLRDGRNLEACNRFGESIVHIMCRRGSLEGLSFLVEKAKASLMVRDDFGRNPLHDAMWTDKPSFDMVKFILTMAPGLLFSKDKRGSMPLAYIPRPRWAEWSNFLTENKELILAIVV